MENGEALAAIQEMHASKTVSRRSIIGWYNFYSHKLPKMTPERSEADLIRTIALWMELTDKGGVPAFPYDYNAHADLKLDLIDRSVPPNASIAWLVGTISMVTGFVLLFFNLLLGLGLLILGLVIWVAGYTMQGGATNMDLFKGGPLKIEAERVLKWANRDTG